MFSPPLKKGAGGIFRSRQHEMYHNTRTPAHGRKVYAWVSIVGVDPVGARHASPVCIADQSMIPVMAGCLTTRRERARRASPLRLVSSANGREIYAWIDRISLDLIARYMLSSWLDSKVQGRLPLLIIHTHRTNQEAH